MAAYDTNNVWEMDIDRLLYTFQQRMEILIKKEGKKHQMDAHHMLDQIENELMPEVDAIVNYDPTPQTAYDFFH